MIRLGCCSFNFGPRTLDDALRLVRDLGFRYVDVSAAHLSGVAQVDQQEAAARPSEVAAEIRAVASRYDLELEEFFIVRVFVNGESVEVNYPDPEVRRRVIEQFRGLTRCAAEAGFKSIMGLPGIVQDELGPEDSWKIAVDMLRTIQKIAEEQRVRFHVEPTCYSIANRPEAALRLIKEVPGMLYTLDYSHTVSLGIPWEEVAVLHEFTGHMHARQGKRDQRQCILAEGEIDFAPIIKRLKEDNWDGVIAVEYVGQTKGPEAEVNPVFQNVVMAYQLGQLITQD